MDFVLSAVLSASINIQGILYSVQKGFCAYKYNNGIINSVNKNKILFYRDCDCCVYQFKLSENFTIL